ncbi:IS200/IS605 family element transposase accessory protein TnpB [Haloarcula sp. JP-Z28]|uniref:Transposase n=1 Tax=Haloarcula marismortui (strain ATCC 43049 / DSM 3752 / JCM 8966 / VKM B-1809) TaxID=272569 RepID=A0A4P8JUY5_HALMA|nr:RNA-guided endonuclease TnpB family protein [Haloarcula marismortui]NHN66024.1 IS200/IS605 family element transposase accessory protein TnpB [Haloarcula sp. JP-Z28]QCP89615.1 transposase [Haloarcula marismortui ATCC 43049]
MAGVLDRHGWSASKLWNVALYYARQQWDETREIPDEKELKRELKTHPKYKGLHSQSSQKVLEELSEAFSSWFGSDDDRDNPPGYRKTNYYDSDGNRVHEEHPRSTVTWKKKGIRHDTKHDRIRLSKGKNHKDGRDFILCEYQTPPAVNLENIQQVRAVYNSAKRRWELHVVCETEITAESPDEKTAGVDLGICNPAAVAFPDDALLYPGDTLREDKHYFQQEEYQTEGPHGPSQKAQWAREKLSRRKDHFLHALSKDIVERCVDHDVGTILVGDPSGVDEDDWGRHGNKRLDNWAYKRLMNLIDYKARERGIEVEMPDERGTSSSCSVCGHEDEDSRVERGLWKCDCCGIVAHGDVNGADNIRQKTLPVTPPLGGSGNGCLAQPCVIQFSRTRGFQPRAPAE